MNKISLFTDLTKHSEFINRLNYILNIDDSTIKYCYMDYQINRHMSITIESFNNTINNSRSFIFNDFFLRPEREDNDFYTNLFKNGFSKRDIDLLIELFDEYTFNNHHEGMFFATRLNSVVEPESKEVRMVFKFTVDESSNRFIVNEQPTIRRYVVIDTHEMPNIYFGIRPDDLKKSSYYKLKNSFSHLTTDTNQSGALEKLKQLHEIGKDAYVLEIYKGFLSYDVYVNNFLSFDGNKIITENLKNWKQH